MKLLATLPPTQHDPGFEVVRACACILELLWSTGRVGV